MFSFFGGFIWIEISFQKEKNIVRVYFTENISVYKIYKNLNLLSSTILNLLKLNITIIIKKIELLYEDNKNKVILKYLDGYLTETLVADFDFNKSKILRIIKKKNTLVEIFPSFTKKIQSNFDLKEITAIWTKNNSKTICIYQIWNY